MRVRVFALVVLCAVLALAQQPITNETVIKMVKAGLAEDVIVTTINAQPGRFSLTADDLIALKGAGVGDKTIAAMVAKGSAPAAAPAAPASPAAPKSAGEFNAEITGGGVAPEIGVYIKKDGQWTELLAEPVNWKTGGALKNIGSLGVVKKDMNGLLAGPHSRTVAKSLEFVIHVREGESYGEYQLLKLRENDNYREFRYITGGVFNQKGGAQRDMFAFEGKRVAPRTYLIVLPGTLPVGEYAFMPPSLITAAGATNQLGKAYTFRVLE